ncbi:MAG TPA: hypothetical protein VMN58_02095 [Acidimicrobiales bacterium]|nr:hypothetical protein [Acidimicrobiales bacterium]
MRRHELEPVPLTAGIVLVLLGSLFALEGAGWTELNLRWLGPLVLLGLGLAGLAISLLRPDE